MADESTGRVAVIDTDDLWCEDQITEHLLPFHEAFGDRGFCVTVYAIPNKLGPVGDLKRKYPWIVFAIHGFEHSHFECLGWTEPLAEHLVGLALKMGYAPLFKAPNWVLDVETERGLVNLGVVLHPHEDYTSTTEGLKIVSYSEGVESIHTHIQKNPVTDFIGDHPKFTGEYLDQFQQFGSPLDYVEEV
jgi:hypothetical protein